MSVERWALKKVAAQDRIGIARRRAITNEIPALFRLLNRPNDLVEIGPFAGLEFGMEQFAISANFEGAAARRNKSKRFNALAQFENFGRQTDGLRRVVSNDAVFD